MMSSPSTPARQPVTTEDRLPRRLGAWSAFAFCVGSIIGSGIYRVPAGVASNTGDVVLLLLIWIAGGVIALLGALALAELAAMNPRAGGIYVYIHEAYGPLWAFVTGWASLFLVPTTLAALAIVFAEYLGTFVPMSPAVTRGAAVAVLVLLAAANYRSVRWAGFIQNASMVARVLSLVALAAIAFAFGTRAPVPPEAAAAPDPGWGAAGLALIAVMWAYNGWQDLTALAGEVRDPARTLPRALIGGTLAIIAIYLLVNAAYLAVLPVEVMARSPLVAADVMTRSIGPGGAAVVAAMVMVSTFGALTAVITTQPRIFFAMAEDGLFFRSIASVHPRFGTPHIAVIFTAIVASIFATFRTFEQLTETFVVGAWPFLAGAVAAVLVLRRRRPDAPRPYRTPGGAIVPTAFVLVSLGLMGSALVQHPIPTLIGIGVTLLGVPIYYAWESRRGHGGATGP